MIWSYEAILFGIQRNIKRIKKQRKILRKEKDLENRKESNSQLGKEIQDFDLNLHKNVAKI